MDRWNAMLGNPRKEYIPNPKDALPIVTQNLAEAYRGQNYELPRRFEHHMSFIDSWYLRIVAPIVKTPSLVITGSKVTFIAEIAPEVSPEGVPPCLTYTKEDWSAQTTRVGLGIYAELGWANTQEGIEFMANQVAQLSASFTERARVDVLATLITTQDHYNHWNNEYGLYGNSGKDAEEVLAEEVMFFCCAQKLDNGLERLSTMINERVSRMMGARPLNCFIMDGVIASYQNVVPQANTQHWLGGDLAVRRINGLVKNWADSMIPSGFKEDSSIPLFMGSASDMVFLTRPVITHPGGPLDPLEGYAQIGEFFTMLMDPRQVTEKYESSSRDQKIYDEDRDQYFLVTQRWIIENCGLFDPVTGAIRNFNSNYPHFASLTGRGAIDDNTRSGVWFTEGNGTHACTTWSGVKMSPEHYRAVGRSMVGALARERGGSSSVALSDFESAINHLEELHMRQFPSNVGNDGRFMADITPPDARAGWNANPVDLDALVGGTADIDEASIRAIEAVRPKILEGYRDAGLIGFLGRPRNDVVDRVSFLADFMEQGAQNPDVDASLGPYTREVGPSDNVSYLGPLKYNDILDPFTPNRSDVLARSYDLVHQQAGCASAAYLRWASVHMPDQGAKQRARNTLNTLSTMVGFLSNIFPGSGIISRDGATPYVDKSPEQAVIEMLLDDVHYAVAITVGTQTEPGDVPEGAQGFRSASDRARAAIPASLRGVGGYLATDPDWQPLIAGQTAPGGVMDGRGTNTAKRVNALRILEAMYKLDDVGVALDKDTSFTGMLSDPIMRAAMLRLASGPPRGAPESSADAELVLSSYEAMFPARTRQAAGAAKFAWTKQRFILLQDLTDLGQMRFGPVLSAELVTEGEVPAGQLGPRPTVPPASYLEVYRTYYTTVTWPKNDNSARFFSWGANHNGTKEVGVLLIPTMMDDPSVVDPDAQFPGQFVVNKTRAAQMGDFLSKMARDKAVRVFQPRDAALGGAAFIPGTHRPFIESRIGAPMAIHARSLPPHVLQQGGGSPSSSREVTGGWQQPQQQIGASFRAFARSQMGHREGLSRGQFPGTRGDIMTVTTGPRRFAERKLGSTLEWFLGAAFMTAPLTSYTLLAMDDRNIYIPWNPFGVRPWNTLATTGILKVRAGITDKINGQTPAILYFSGPTSVLMGSDANTQTIRGTVITYGKTFVSDPKCVYHARHVASKHSYGGLGTKVIDPEEWDVTRHDPSVHGSIILIPEGPNFEGFPDGRMDITGDYHALKRRGITLRGPTDSMGRPTLHYPLAPFIVDLYQLDKMVWIGMNAGPRWHGPFSIMAPLGANNPICYQGLQYGRDRAGGFTIQTIGTGHWGSAQGPGNKGVRMGQLKRAMNHEYNRPAGGRGPLSLLDGA